MKTSSNVSKIKGKKGTESGSDSPFPIVAIGASAGGLEAFTKLLSNLPVDTGMAFVILQHLDPKHESMSPSILSRVTKLSVCEVKDNTEVLANHVYILPPGFSMEISKRILTLNPRIESRGMHLVIDHFFESLADDQKNCAIGVVLSGTGSDGTEGLIAIKASGGIAIVQTPASAKFDGMPQSAIAAGVADLVLPPEQIAEELERIAHHPYVAQIASIGLEAEAAPTEIKDPQDNLSQIFQLLRKHCHVDFTFYKSATVKRRIERRMAFQKMNNLKSYAQYLAQNHDEVKALYADILIHVTGFFRDPEAFASLKADVFSKLVANRAAGVPIRIWVTGCSTGEEVYSVAISIIEFLAENASHTPIQIFASDISEQAIQKARLGEYSEAIAKDVSPERLNRFFNKSEDGSYKIAKSIRDICLFSRHDVTADPPYARIDLICCRNLLIYFAPTLQKHVIPIFHYSLKQDAFLWLGKSETVGGFSELFSVVDKTNRIYQRKNSAGTPILHFPASTYIHGKKAALPQRLTLNPGIRDLQKLAEQAVQIEYPGVLINQDMEILHLRGRTAPFIEPFAGMPSFNLLKMAHPDLIRELRMGIQSALKSKSSIKKEGLSLREGKTRRTYSLNIIPLPATENSKEKLFLILFEKYTEPSAKKKFSAKNRVPAKKDPYIMELQSELNKSEEYQTTLVERFEAAQEDLMSTNEELQSANEEMQSTNEELETAKEELQSGNEELTTVNDELQTRSIEQNQSNNDLINLLGSVEIPIVMLDNDRKIRRFTPLAGKALNLLATDIGRLLTDFKLNFSSPNSILDLDQMVSDAIESTKSQEVEVRDSKGHWFRLQVRPYKTVDNKIDGAVLALVDIDTLKHSLKAVKAARLEAEQANRAKDLFLATLSHELRTPLSAILSWSQMLASGQLDTEKMRRGAEIIEGSAKTQAQLINDLLDVSRIVSGKIALESHLLDPVSIVQNAIEAVRPLAEAKSIEIVTTFSPKVDIVLADPVRLQQVFWNLLSNAVKFSSPGSKVTVQTEREQAKDGHRAKAIIKVQDTGKGILPDFIHRIFDKFSQADDSSIRFHGGLGLGLAIVRNLVELQGGTVTAESLGDQQGATFTVILPIHSDQLESETQASIAPKHSDSKAVQPLRLDGLRALVVDDEENTREAFGEVLRSYGAETQLASSAKEGLKLFAHFNPHVILSDIAMPGEDGYSLIQKIRALPEAEGCNTPALAITAYAGSEDVRRALKAGFQAHLAKPIDGLDLAKAVFNITRVTSA